MKKLNFSFRNLFARPTHDTKSAQRNRNDIHQQFNRCYSIADLNVLQEVLRYCASDFDTSDFIRLLHDLDGRRQLLEIIEEKYGNAFIDADELIAMLIRASYPELCMIQIIISRDWVKYSRRDQVLLSKYYLARRDEMKVNLEKYAE